MGLSPHEYLPFERSSRGLSALAGVPLGSYPLSGSEKPLFAMTALPKGIPR